MAMQKIKLISWNINGMNSAKKRRHIFHWINKQACNIVCIQETHIKKADAKYLNNKNLGEKFISLIDKKKRGTVIYVKSELNPKQVFTDE